jgi:hypothetical protein
MDVIISLKSSLKSAFFAKTRAPLLVLKLNEGADSANQMPGMNLLGDFSYFINISGGYGDGNGTSR